ncbi:MAG: carbohydrate kinase [Bacilli bacterium]|nr:carbohydrate kinase [Bacilli bacterium]
MLICIGEILVDIFDDGHHRDILPGGAPFNVACNALLYTDKVTFYGAVGHDDNGKLLLATVNRRGFYQPHIKVLEDRYTSRAIVTLNNGERSFHFERDLGADYILDINDIDISSIKDDDIIHIGSLMLSYQEGRDFFYQLVNKIRTYTHAKISFDINYRDDIFSSPDEAKNVFLSALKEADILKFSEEEISLFSKEKNITKALDGLLNDKQIAVVTLGSKGSIYYHSGHTVHVNTYPVKPVDTTGAGDAFYSYFLSSLINHPTLINSDKDIIHYLTRANVVGGLATLKKGAIDSAPNEEMIDEFLNKQ